MGMHRCPHPCAVGKSCWKKQHLSICAQVGCQGYRQRRVCEEGAPRTAAAGRVRQAIGASSGRPAAARVGARYC